MCSDTQRNVQAVERMLEAAKEHTEPVSAKPSVGEQNGLPLTEIREDLDEEGNILCAY